MDKKSFKGRRPQKKTKSLNGQSITHKILTSLNLLSDFGLKKKKNQLYAVDFDHYTHIDKRTKERKKTN